MEGVVGIQQRGLQEVSMRTFQVPATLEGVSTLKDGGVSVRLHTQELSPEEKAIAMGYQNQFGWLLFKPEQHDEKELEQLEHIRKDTGGKSPSQRLRSVLFVLYQQGSRDTTFDQFYSMKMEQIIDNIKSRLD